MNCSRTARAPFRRPLTALLTWLVLVTFAPLGLRFAAAAPQAGAQAGTAPAKAANTNAPAFEKEILAFEASDRTNPPPTGSVLFVGSSSIRLWKTLAADFPVHRVINRGFGGSQIADSIRYADRIILPYKPRLVVVYAGGNDINAKKSPERVFEDFKSLVSTIHARLPETQIAFISIAPNPARWSQIEQVRDANQRIARFIATDPRLRYIDTHTHMLGPDGQPKPDIFVSDRLHMNAEGYKIWTRVVAPYLKAWPTP